MAGSSTMAPPEDADNYVGMKPDWARPASIGGTLTGTGMSTGTNISEVAIWKKALTANQLKLIVLSFLESEKEVVIKPAYSRGGRDITVIRNNFKKANILRPSIIYSVDDNFTTNFRGARAVKGHPIRQKLVHHNAERVDIGATVHASRTGNLLRRHISGRPDHRALSTHIGDVVQ